MTMTDEQNDDSIAIKKIQSPLLIAWREGRRTYYVLHPPQGYDHRHYAMLLSDLVRHVANHFNIDVREVWQWIDAERFNPTSKVSLEEITHKELKRRMEKTLT
jgi:hypothetical protein